MSIVPAQAIAPRPGGHTGRARDRAAVLAVSIAATLGLAACGKAPSPPPGDVVAHLALPRLHPDASPSDRELRLAGHFDPDSVRGKKLLINFWRPG